MLLIKSTWPEMEAYLDHSDGIVIPIGSIEQHGPTGLLGTDAMCPEIIAKRAAEQWNFLIGPTFSVGVAQQHIGFPGSITLRPSTMIQALTDWIDSLSGQGFKRFYFLNGHGGNIATITAAFSEIFTRHSFSREAAPVSFKLRNWWQIESVEALSNDLYAPGLGRHAMPSEISVTYAAYPDAIRNV